MGAIKSKLAYCLPKWFQDNNVKELQPGSLKGLASPNLITQDRTTSDVCLCPCLTTLLPLSNDSFGDVSPLFRTLFDAIEEELVLLLSAILTSSFNPVRPLKRCLSPIEFPPTLEKMQVIKTEEGKKGNPSLD